MLTASPGKKKPDCLLQHRQLALLGALCLFLSAVEYMIPKPLPFLRIGLANLPVMLACDIFPLSAFFILVCIKIFGQALITGTLFSYVFLFSMTGTLLSAFFMFALRFLFGRERITFIGIGTAGAFFSNISQLALAYFFIFRENVFYIAPLFITIGLLTGIILGIFCEEFTRRSLWYENNINRKSVQNIIRKEDKTAELHRVLNPGANASSVHSVERFFNDAISAKILFIAGLIIMPALLFNPSTEYRVIQFLFFLFLARFSGKKINFIFTLLITLFIIAFNLIIPYGRILFSMGAFKITSGALEAGIYRAVTLQSLIMLSKVTIRDDLKIPGFFGRLLGESLRIFSLIAGRKHLFIQKSTMQTKDINLIAKIDNMMLELSQEEIPQSDIKETKTTPLGYLVLIIIIAVSWTLFLLAI